MPKFTVLYRRSFVSLIELGYLLVPSPDVYASGVAVGNLTPANGLETVVSSGSDIQISPYTGHCRAFDSAGNVLWTFESPTYNSFGMDVAIGDVDEDGQNEVAFATNYQEAKVYLLDENGNEIWHWAAHGTGYQYTRGVAIGKLRNDYPGNQVVVSGYNGQLALLDKDGNEIWFKDLAGTATVQTVEIADIDADGQNEIIVSRDLYVEVYDNTGTLVWSTQIGDGTATVLSAKTGNVTPASGLEIAATIYPRFDTPGLMRVALLDKDGNILWTWNAPYGCSGLAVADVNGDGYDEVIVGYGNHDAETPNPNVDNGGISILSSDGNLMTSVDMASTVGFIIYADINNDGENEIVASCDDGKVHIFRVISAN